MPVGWLLTTCPLEFCTTLSSPLTEPEANGCVRGCLTNHPFYAVVFKPLEHLACEGECEAILCEYSIVHLALFEVARPSHPIIAVLACRARLQVL
jgi:hypothetical protein